MKTTIKIHQLDKNKESARRIRFIDFSWLEDLKCEFEKENYIEVYSYENEYDFFDLDYALESVFAKFNINRPTDFKGHSLSVSDIIQIDNKYFYVNSIGFKEVTKLW